MAEPAPAAATTAMPAIETLPVLPLRDSVVFPFMMVPLVVSDPSLIQLADAALAGNKRLALFTQKSTQQDAATAMDLHDVGTAAMIYRMLRAPDGTLRLLVQGMARVRIQKLTQAKPHMVAEVESLAEKMPPVADIDLPSKHVVGLFQELVDASPHLPEELKTVATGLTEPGRLADFIASNLSLDIEAKQSILSELDVAERVKKLGVLLAREHELQQLSQKIQTDVRTEMDRGQREYYLREQMKAIRKELGEGSEGVADQEDLLRRIDEANLPPEADAAARRDLERLQSIPTASPEYSVARTFLDWVLSLNWNPEPNPPIDLDAAQAVLDADHHDLEKVKRRIIEYLAVLKLKPDSKGPILCLVGPPGVGKTSLGTSIARALGRPFVRLALGGVRDEAEIRGHRRTYVGALPGRIIQSLARTKGPSPVFMLDEVDKLGNDFRGDPASALLEVLDPAQNDSFTDLYLGVPFNLRPVFFICTANMLDTIPDALLDRLEILELPGYSNEEKLLIARRYLVPRQVAENGLTEDRIRIPDETLRKIIADYTMEAGVRNLEREIASICRKVARTVAGGSDVSLEITPESLPEYLGGARFFRERAAATPQVGVVTGLAWTAAGGEILFIEVMGMPGGGGVQLTGNLGGVMRESVQAALSWVRAHSSELSIHPEWFASHDLHLHVPGGGVPKDGPSAGVAMTIGIASLASGRPVSPTLAMTGEVTLSGRVLPVGGIRQKVQAAHRAGITDLVLPAQNERDLEEVPEEIRSALHFHFADTLDQALAVAFPESAKPLQARRRAARRRAEAPPKGRPKAGKPEASGKRSPAAAKSNRKSAKPATRPPKSRPKPGARAARGRHGSR